MAKITDPDSLNVGTELTVDTSAKTFTLNVAGNLVAKDGVTIQALYSKFIDLWTSATYQNYPFPMYAIDARSGQFQFGFDGATYNGWKPADDATRQKLRDGGWSEYSGAGVLQRQYVGAIALASGFPTGAQFYYQKTSTGSASNFTFTDAPNEGIQVYGDASNGNFDSRTYFRVFCREYNYTYDDSVLSDIGETGTGAFKISLPVSVGSDLKIQAADGTVSSSSPYSAINVKFFSGSYQREVDTAGTARNFGIVIDVGTHSGIDGSMTASGNTLTSAAGSITGSDYTGGTVVVHEGTNKGTYTISGTPTSTVVTITGTFSATESNASFTLHRASDVSATAEQIYTKIQYLLRQNSDIDSTSGSVTGKTAAALLAFVGDTLIAGQTASNPNGGGSGVFIEGFSSNDINRITFYDNTTTARTFPFTASGTMTFNSFLQGAGSYYRMYFTTLPGANNDYGESGAVTVDDSAGADIAGTISSGSISFTFAYDSNTQGGRTAGTDATITLVAGRPGYAKPVVTTSTITRSTGLSIAAVAEQDRAYST